MRKRRSLAASDAEDSEPQARDVHIALGSNLASSAGDRLATLAAALERLCSDGTNSVVARSGAYETDPVPPGQPMYLNAAAVIRTSMPLDELLRRMHDVERSLGRVRANETRWGPRTIDLDILLSGESIQDSPGLTVPHPRLHERLFVLIPLAEIAPTLLVPTLRQSVASLLASLLRTHSLPNGWQDPEATSAVFPEARELPALLRRTRSTILGVRFEADLPRTSCSSERPSTS